MSSVRFGCLSIQSLFFITGSIFIFGLFFSTALTGIGAFVLLVLSTLVFVFNRNSYGLLRHFIDTNRMTVFILVILLFHIFISSIWSVGSPSDILHGLSKYKKLPFGILLGYVLWIYGGQVTLGRLFKVFIICGLAVAIGILLAQAGVPERILGPWSNYPHLPGWWHLVVGDTIVLRIGTPDNPTFGRNHITGAVLLACTLIPLIFNSININMGKSVRFLGNFIIVLALLALASRTALFVLMVTALISLFWICRRNNIGVFVPIVLFLLIPTLYYFTFDSTGMHQAITSSIGQVADVVRGSSKVSSTAERFNLQYVGLHEWVMSPLFKKIFGFGVGSYGEIYKTSSLSLEYMRHTNPHPHSELINFLVQFGVFGTALMMVVVYRLITAVECQTIRGLIILLVSNWLINSGIWDMTEGYIFVFVVAAAFVSTMTLAKNSQSSDGESTAKLS